MLTSQNSSMLFKNEDLVVQNHDYPIATEIPRGYINGCLLIELLKKVVLFFNVLN